MGKEKEKGGDFEAEAAKGSRFSLTDPSISRDTGTRKINFYQSRNGD